PLLVRTDPERVQQVVKNLLSNALKYTPPPGEVSVEVGTAVDDELPGAWATIVVADSAPGLAGEERELVFREFHRIPGTERAGHGLGLAISRRIARMLGGELTLRGEEGPGSSFVLWLPLTPEEEAALPPRRDEVPAREAPLTKWGDDAPAAETGPSTG